MGLQRFWATQEAIGTLTLRPPVYEWPQEYVQLRPRDEFFFKGRDGIVANDYTSHPSNIANLMSIGLGLIYLKYCGLDWVGVFEANIGVHQLRIIIYGMHTIPSLL